ncbi:pentatricopeptide repeat-containing protein [Tanacetum coccineum]
MRSSKPFGDTIGDPIDAIINVIYPDVVANLSTPGYFEDRPILAPTNNVVNKINERMMKLIPTEERVSYVKEFSGCICQIFGDEIEILFIVSLQFGCIYIWELGRVWMAPSGSDALYFDVHHDGVFVLNPLRYEHGLVYDWKLYKNRKMDYKTMCEFLKEKTDHAGFTALYFCLPECDLEVGLKIIERDSDVAAMYDFANSYGKLNIFMSHIHQNLAEFYFQNLNMEESRDEATSRLRIHEIMVKDASNMSYDELVSWAEDEAEMQTPKKKVVTPKKKLVEHVVDDVDIPLMNLVESPKLKRKLLVRNSPSPITKRELMGKGTSPTSYVVNKGKSVLNEGNTVKKAVDKGKSTMVEEENTVKKVVDKGKSRNVCRNNGIVIEDNVNPTVKSDTDSESNPGNGINYSMYSDSDSDSDTEYSDKSVDYLSEGEEELIQLRKRKTEAKNAPKVRDANNHIFPVAWAIVNVENKDNWSWFLDLLGDDLEMPTGQGLTLMSDQHKGLIEAVKEVMPYAEHRQCARHIYEGFRKLYSGVEFRLLFWAAAKATYPGLFNKIMEKIKRANPNAYDYLLKKEPKTWSRAYFHLGTNCEAVENGFSECFNSVILSVRSKPLITMLEAIRVIVLERMHIMRNLCDKWTADICPNIQKRLEITKDQHRFWHVIPTGGNLFEVRNGSEAFGVDEDRRNCSCRLWQLSGLPCCHAIAVIFKLNRMVEDYVPDCYRKQAFYDTYHQYLTPVGGMTFWPDCSDMSRVLPPKLRTMPRRPKKKRIRADHENKNPNKVSKAGVTMTCTNCHQKGHNKKGCKNPTVVLPPKPPTKKVRPRKTPVVGSSLIDEEIETPAVDEQVGVEEQASQYDVGGSSQFDVGGEEQASQYDVEGSSKFDDLGEEQVRVKRGDSTQFGVQRGRRVKTTVKREESDPIENSKMAQETNQNAANDSFAATQETHQFSATAFASTQNSQNHQVSEQEPQAAEQEPHRARPRGILNFIRPRPRSERILKKQLAKKVHGIGSTSSNALNLE